MIRLSVGPLIRLVRMSLGAVSHKFKGTVTTSASCALGNNPCDEAQGTPMFMLPAYDATAIAMLGFGILAAAALTFGF